jgi:hypothetical protein
MEPITVLKTSGEAVTLVAAIAKLIKENKETHSAPLAELLQRVQIEAVRMSSSMEVRLQVLNENLGTLGLDPSKTLDTQIRDLKWYNWVRRAQLKAYREEFHAVYRQLTALIDDVTALLLCEGSHAYDANGMPIKGGVPIKTEAFAVAYGKKRDLDALVTDQGRSLGDILERLLATARQVTEELRAA